MATDREKQIAGQCFKAGNDAMIKGNFDYAMQMYGQAAKLVKDYLAFRQSLRASQKKFYKDNKTGAGMMQKTKLMSVKGKISKLKGQKNTNWDEVDETCEEGLKLNPWDHLLNFELAISARERGYDEIAVLCFKEAVSPDGEPKKLEYLSTYANFEEKRQHFEEAIGVWQAIQRYYPDDMEARQKIMKLQAEKTIVRGNFESANSTKDVMTDEEIKARIKVKDKKAEDAEAPGESIEADLMRAIRKDPENRDLHMKLGDYYRKENQLVKAIEAYKQADALSGGNMSIREQIEDVELLILKRETENASEKAQENPASKELALKAKELGNKLLKRELDVFKNRVQRYPQNMKLKLELARRHRHMKNWAEAIPLLQQASTDARFEVDALVMLGKCFLQDDKGSMALRQFAKVSPKLSFGDRPDSYKEVHYYLGRLYEQIGDIKNALDNYGKVLEVDYNYRDTRARFDKLESENTPGSSGSGGGTSNQ